MMMRHRVIVRRSRLSPRFVNSLVLLSMGKKNARLVRRRVK